MKLTRKVRKVVLVALAAALAACTHQIATRPDTFSLDAAATARLSKAGAVALNNAYQAESPVSIPVEQHTYVVEQKQMTDTAIAMLRRALEKHGVAVSAQSAKQITLRVREPTSRFGLIALTPRYGAAVALDAELGDGTVVSATSENESPLSPERAFEGALLFVLNRLVADEGFIAYMNR